MSLSLPENASSADQPQTAAFFQITQALTTAGIPFRFQAVGQSMYPTILNGEMLHVEPIGRYRLKSGDIVLFRSNGKFKAHRIVQLNAENVITRGDDSAQEDGVLNRAQIVGLVVAKECCRSGELTNLAGIAARLRFRLRRLRSRVGRTLRAFVVGDNLSP